ncbi:hypothetical protein [Nitrococcus mobilis]|uniref:N-acetyltransferase n=1 Tax=Nitrococcus mobilis Nb-231 TaxID=314278 RepID=A4BRB7_9GAMM|nr:hypothetical protein [Nitrococcus mobilis]EAR21739.1 N-acetyltransferase [Nitrococcus mobilis Nb-231]
MHDRGLLFQDGSPDSERSASRHLQIKATPGTGLKLSLVPVYPGCSACADDYGVVALDVRMRVRRSCATHSNRLAIRPHLKEFEEEIPVGEGPKLLLRPIRLEDAPALQKGFTRLTPKETRLRFLMPLKVLSHMMAAQFTQIDYDREMALVLADPGIASQTESYSVARIVTDPNNEQAEYTITVRHDIMGRG